jgi:hypothetical protein
MYLGNDFYQSPNTFEIFLNPETGQLDRRSKPMNGNLKETLDKAMKTMFALSSAGSRNTPLK